MTDRELVAAYVLGELEGPERADFERRLQGQASLRTELEAMTHLSAGLEALPADAWQGSEPTPVAAPAPVPAPEAGSVPAAAAEPADADPMPPERPSPPPRRWFARPAFALGAVVGALVIGAVVGDLLAGGSDSSGSGGGGEPTSAAVALVPLEGGSKAAAVVRVGSDRTVELDTHNLPSPGRNHYYELWLMTDAAKTVPLASFGVGGSGRATVRVPLPANPRGFRYYDISRQAVGGGTGHSSESVLRGPTGAAAY